MTNERGHLAILTSATNAAMAPRWGDTHYAGSLASAFARRGVHARVYTRDEWDGAGVGESRAVIHLRGLYATAPRSNGVNILWIISHGESVTDDELNAFDLVLVASREFAEGIRARTSRRVEVFHQATDTCTFAPQRYPRRCAHGVIVVANFRWPYRPGPRWLMELGHSFQLFGANWAGRPEQRFLASGYVPNDQLADIYSTADIVVADQWGEMSHGGFVANRVFDVAACGGFVVSTASSGITEIFGDTVPTYTSRAELDELVRRHRRDSSRRHTLAQEAMRIARGAHSFDTRVHELIGMLGRDAFGG